MSLGDRETSKLEDVLDENDVEELDETNFSNPTLMECANYLADQFRIFLSGEPLSGKNAAYEICYEQRPARGYVEEKLIITAPNKIEARFYTARDNCLRTIFVPRQHLLKFIEQNPKYKENVHLGSQHETTGFTEYVSIGYEEIIHSLSYLDTPK